MPTLLLVEDNHVYGELMKRRLEQRGYAVKVALDGALGLEVAAREKPDLIIMDGSLPGIDGWETSRRLKADPVTAAIPIIALSGHTLPEDREASLASGCDEFEAKPPVMSSLVAKIESLLARARP